MKKRSNIFSLTRFWQVLMKEIKENGRSRLMYYLTIVGIITGLFIWLSIVKYDGSTGKVAFDPAWESIQPFFFFGMVFFCCITASVLLGNMSTKGGRTALLTLPASNLEKFLSRWIIHLKIYPVLFAFALILADLLRVVILTPFFGQKNHIACFPLSLFWGNHIEGVSTMIDGPMEFCILLGFFYIIVSLFGLGSTIWHKNAFAKTGLYAIIILLSFVFIGYLLVEGVYSDRQDFSAHLDFQIKDGYISFIIEILIAIAINVLAYFRFKESEIIERW